MAAPLILVEAKPRRVDTGAEVAVYLAGGGGALPYLYDGHHWRGGITGLPKTVAAIDYNGEDLGTGSVPQAMVLNWAPAGSAGVAEMAAYHWADASITVRVGPEGAFPPVDTSGKVLSATVDGGVLAIALADGAADLKKPILTDRYAGTGGLEGPIEWEGKIKRRVWGQRFNLAGDMIDAANNILCFADPTRRLQAFDAVRDKGAAGAPGALTLLAWQGSAAATFAALQAAVAPQGGGVLCPSIACVKWWTQPAGALCVDLRGEVGAGYVETAASIAERIAGAVSAIPFAAGTVAAANAARGMAAGWLAADESGTAAAALDKLLSDVSLLWVLDGDAIDLRRWEWSAPVASARSLSVSRNASFRPVSCRRLGYRENLNVMSRDAIAGIVLATDVSFGDGTSLENLQPAEAGADVTGDHTSADTDAVGGVPAGDVLSALDALTGDVADADAAIAAEAARLDARIDDSEDAIAGVAADLGLEADRLDDRIDDAGSAIDTVAGAIAAASAELGGRIDDAEGALDALEASLGATNGDLADVAAELVQVSQTLVAEHSAGAYQAELAAVRAGLGQVAALAERSLNVTADMASAYQRERLSASFGLAQVSVIAETKIRATQDQAAFDQISAVDVKIETPATGLKARLATAESAVVDLQTNKVAVSAFNTLSATVTGHTSSIGTLQTGLGTAQDDIDDLEAAQAAQGTRLTTAEGSITSQAGLISSLSLDLDGLDGSLALVAGDLAALDDRVGDVEGVAGTLVGTVSGLSATVTSQGDRLDDAEDAIATSEASITSLQAVGATDRAATLRQSELAAVRAGLGQVAALAERSLNVTADMASAYQRERLSASFGLAQVSVFAETKIRATQDQAAFDQISAVDLKIETPATGLKARLATAESAVVDLQTNKVAVSTFNTLSATVTGHTSSIGTLQTGLSTAQGDIDDLEAAQTAQGTRLTTAEGSITSQAGLISSLSLDLDGLDGSLALVAGDLAALDDRVGDVEGVAGTLVTTVTGLSATVTSQGDRLDDAEDAIATSEASITSLQGAGVTANAATLRLSQLAAIRVGLSQVSVLAETDVRATQDQAAFDQISAVDLKIETPIVGLKARLATAESAVVDLQTNKVEVSTFNTLSATVSSLDGDVVDLAADMSTLQTAVTDLEAGKADASSLSTLSARVDDTEASITDISEVAASADGIAKATVGLVLDVDGKISGTRSENDGETSRFDIVADIFSVTSGDAGFVWSDGAQKIYDEDGDLMILIGRRDP